MIKHNLIQIILILALVLVAIFSAGLQHFTHHIRGLGQGGESQLLGEAITVVTGSGGRIEAGFALMESSGTPPPKMLISGIGVGVSKSDIIRLANANNAFDNLWLNRVIDCCVTLGRRARDTKGNAVETAQWLQKNPAESLVLVTSDFHIPRALVEFHRVLANTAIIPYPVATIGLDKGWWHNPTSIGIIFREYSKYLASTIL